MLALCVNLLKEDVLNHWNFSAVAARIIRGPPPCFSLSTTPTHLLPRSLPLPHLLRHEHGQNGCGDDAVCLGALWVTSGSSCVAVHVQSLSAAEWEPLEMKMNLFQNAVFPFPLWMHQLHEDVLTFSVETLLLFFFNDPVHGYWRCWGMCELTTCPWSKCGLVLPSAGLNRYRRSSELRHALAGVDPDGFCHTHIRDFEPILAEVDAIKTGGWMLPRDIWPARPLLKITLSLPAGEPGLRARGINAPVQATVQPAAQ